MIKIENDCVDCGLPCIDCGRKRTPHYYCDMCEDEAPLYVFENGFIGSMELCADCLLGQFEKVEGSD